MDHVLQFFQQLDNLVWGAPLLVLLVGTGIYLTLRLGLLQIRYLPKAFRLIFTEDEGHGDISSFGALATALAATVGTGNIVGVATAIQTGGPGALFWMWMAAFFGMATKYAEGLLAIRYRTKDDNGHISGGPMYYILHGMGEKWRPLAIFFAVAGVLVALFGIGTMTQVNSITGSLQASFGTAPEVASVVIALVVSTIIFGGIHWISKVSEKVVPFMAAAYIFATITIIVLHLDQLLPALKSVFSGAFTGTAAMGGFAGATVKMAIQKGVARGVFGEWMAKGSTSTLTQDTFTGAFGPVGGIILTLCLVLFATTTILGWSYYGERCFEFLFGVKHINLYRTFFVFMVGLGGFLKLDLVWVIADIVNGLMALPNLIALLALSPVIIKESKQYFKK